MKIQTVNQENLHFAEGRLSDHFLKYPYSIYILVLNVYLDLKCTISYCYAQYPFPEHVKDLAREDPRAEAEGEDEEDGNDADHLSQHGESDESDYAPAKGAESDSGSAEDDLPPEEGLEATQQGKLKIVKPAKPIVAGSRTAASMKTPASYSLSQSSSSSSASSSTSSSTSSSSQAFPSMGWNLPVQESLTNKVLSANSVANGRATSG